MTRYLETRRVILSRWVLATGCAIATGVLLWAIMEVPSSRAIHAIGELSDLQSTDFFTETDPLAIPPAVPIFTEVLSVEDAVAENGMWFLLDASAQSVHRFAPSGELVGSFGRRGSGPGEFGGMPASILAHADTIVVSEFDGNQLHLYSPAGISLGDRFLRLDSCVLPQIRDMASSPRGLLFLTTCRRQDMRSETRVILEDKDGAMRILATRLPDPDGPIVLDAFTPPVLASHPEGFVFGSTGDQCLYVYDLDGKIINSVCHEWLPPLSIPKEIVSEMRSRYSGRSNVQWTLPDHFYPIDQVFVTQDERWMYRVLASNNPISYTLLAPGRDVTMSSVPRASYLFVHGESVLVGWEDLEGTRIAIHPLEER